MAVVLRFWERRESAQESWETTASSYPGASFIDGFESYGLHGNPPGWFDSAPGNPQQEAPGLYQTLADPLTASNKTFGKESASNSYTHLRTQAFSAQVAFRFSGRMMRTGSSALMGVTFFSGFPDSQKFFLLAQGTNSGTVRLSYTQGQGCTLNGAVDSGQSLAVSKWYRFRVEATPASGECTHPCTRLGPGPERAVSLAHRCHGEGFEPPSRVGLVFGQRLGKQALGIDINAVADRRAAPITTHR